MPLKTYTTKADFDSDYSIDAEPDGHPSTRNEVRLGYSRAVLYPEARRRAVGIANAMAWTAPGPVLVIFGAGYSWLAEAMETDLGFTRVVGIDISPYIQSTKSLDESADYDAAIIAAGLNPLSGEGAAVKAKIIARVGSGPRVRASRGVLNEDGSANASWNRVRQSLGLSGNAQPDWVLSELVLDAIDDAMFLTLSARLRSRVPNLAHFTATTLIAPPDENWNGKTLEQWKALQPLDTFIEKQSYRRL